MASCAVRGRAKDDDPMATCGLELVLEMEVPAWPTEDSCGVTRIDPQDGLGEPGMG